MYKMIRDGSGLEDLFTRELKDRLLCREDDKDEVMSNLRRDIYEFIEYLDEQIENHIDDLNMGR